MPAMFRSLQIRRGGWQDLFIARELAHIPAGPDRYAMLMVKALASCLGAWVISLGPVAALLLPSEHISVGGYGYVTDGAGLAAGLICLLGGDLADRFSRIRILLWGMLLPVGLMFALASLRDGEPALFYLLYVLMAWSELFAVVTVSALLRDFSPRTGRAFGVALVAVGTLGANWGTTFMAGHLLASVGTWQHMYLYFGYVAVALWLVIWLLGREPSRGIRNQILPSMRDAARVQANARVLEERGVKVLGFWRYLAADWRLWALTVAQGAFLLGYHTFVSYGPLFTIDAFHKSPQEGSALTSWIYLSVIVFLVLGGIASDRLRLRKSLGLIFTILSGAGLLILGSLSDHALSSAGIVVAYVVIGAVMGITWPPMLALFSETAEDIHASRQTTAFAGMNMVTGTMYHSWVIVIPIVLASAGWRWVWFIAGLGALATAPILLICRGSLRRFTLPEVPVLAGAGAVLSQFAERDLGSGAST